MWVLLLNDMRASNIENLQPVCRAESYQELLNYVKREQVEPYRDGQWAKVFRKDGPLEWFNPPWNLERNFANAGTREDWMQKAGESYDQQVASLPLVEAVLPVEDKP
jgi:hypothetical protein